MENGHFNWLVKPLGYQSITKRCPSCEVKKLFYPSGCFRVNAQKKTLDVWNIYKCEKCDYTWNIDIFSRISPKKLDPELHEHFLHNNLDQVRRCAYDYSTLKKNSAELGPTPDFHIEGPDPYALSNRAAVRIQVLIEQLIPVRLISLLTRKLSLSRSEVLRLIEYQVILDITPVELNKKLKRPFSFRLDLERFYQLDPPVSAPVAHSLENQ